MSHLFDQYLSVADPFGHGDDAVGLGLMTDLTDGLMFPWLEGGTVLLRRALYPTPSRWGYCGVSTPAKATIKSYAGYAHQGNQAYQYSTATLLGNGMISRASNPVRIDFDGTKTLINPGLPGWPRNVTPTPIAAGKFLITWEYDTFGQAAFPKDFQVFVGSTQAAISYAAALVDAVTGLSAVPYEPHRRVYSFTTQAWTHLRPRSYVVRSRNVNGVSEKNTNATEVQLARLNAPAPAPAAALIHVGLHSRGSG